MVTGPSSDRMGASCQPHAAAAFSGSLAAARLLGAAPKTFLALRSQTIAPASIVSEGDMSIRPTNTSAGLASSP